MEIIFKDEALFSKFHKKHKLLKNLHSVPQHPGWKWMKRYAAFARETSHYLYFKMMILLLLFHAKGLL